MTAHMGLLERYSLRTAEELVLPNYFLIFSSDTILWGIAEAVDVCKCFVVLKSLLLTAINGIKIDANS